VALAPKFKETKLKSLLVLLIISIKFYEMAPPNKNIIQTYPLNIPNILLV